MNSRRLAYACFAYLALFSVAAIGLEVLPLPFSTYQVIGMVVGLPAAMLAAAAALAGIGLALIRHRERRLLIMSATTAGMTILLALGESLPAEQFVRYRYALHAGMGCCVLALVILSLRWLQSERSKR